jgi:cation:H+ antiporter
MRPGQSGVTFEEAIGWSEPDAGPLRRIVGRFALATLLILISAPLVAISARDIARSTGIEEGFLGAALLAVVTSLPELVASLAAIKIGAYDLAVGNLFGSNAANMTVLFFADLAYRPGPLLAAVRPQQVVSALGAIALTSLAVAAIVGGNETRIRRLEPDAIVLLIGYALLLTAVGFS